MQRVTTWANVLEEEPTKELENRILLHGGLFTTELPYGTPGACDEREAINGMAAHYLWQEGLFNPVYLVEAAKEKDYPGHPTRVRYTRTQHATTTQRATTTQHAREQ